MGDPLVVFTNVTCKCLSVGKCSGKWAIHSCFGGEQIYIVIFIVLFLKLFNRWLRGTVVERGFLTGKLCSRKWPPAK